MAKLRSDLLEETLRGVASMLPDAHARVTSGWLELTAPLPESMRSRYDDVAGLRVSSQLPGSNRVARHFGARDPHLRADARVERVADLREWLLAACAAFKNMPFDIAQGEPFDIAHGEHRPPHVAPGSSADVEHACAETGWRTFAGDGADLHVVIPTRAGEYTARLEPSASTWPRFVVDLIDLAGQPEVRRRATAALLVAVSGSVRSVKSGLVDRDGATVAVLTSSLDGTFDRAVDEALSALGLACQLAGREVHALVDERLASEYLALSRGSFEEDIHSLMEVETCLQ